MFHNKRLHYQINMHKSLSVMGKKLANFQNNFFKHFFKNTAEKMSLPNLFAQPV